MIENEDNLLLLQQGGIQMIDSDAEKLGGALAEDSILLRPLLRISDHAPLPPS